MIKKNNGIIFFFFWNDFVFIEKDIKLSEELNLSEIDFCWYSFGDEEFWSFSFPELKEVKNKLLFSKRRFELLKILFFEESEYEPEISIKGTFPFCAE